jgi:hypothetical protein
MKKAMMRMFALLAMSAVLFGATHAGDLEPPGPPAPTMVTLQEIFDKLDGFGACVAGVPKSGQTQCWDASGALVDCAGTGQDGEYQMGVSVGPRFTDNGDGTVTDNLTKLIWLLDANCFGAQQWQAALDAANTLADGSCGLIDSSVGGDWRLPNVRELHTLIDYGTSDPALPAGHPFFGVQTGTYWSSTTYANLTSHAWTLAPFGGNVNVSIKTNSIFVWPVRGRQ